MRFERWTVVLAVIAALPAIPTPHWLRAVSLGTTLGTTLYVASLVIAAILAFRASANEERARKAEQTAANAKLDEKLDAILEAKSPGELHAQIQELRDSLDFSESRSDGMFS